MTQQTDDTRLRAADADRADREAPAPAFPVAIKGLGKAHGDGGDWTAQIEIDLAEDGASATLSAQAAHSSEQNSWPAEVYHGRLQRWTRTLSSGSAGVPDAAAMAAFATEVAPLLARVAAGHSVEHDGQNMVGRLTDDATEASDRIDELLDEAQLWDEQAMAWDPGEWIGDCDDVTAATTDAEIDKLIPGYEAQARGDSVYFTADLREAMIAARDERAAERREELADALEDAEPDDLAEVLEWRVEQAAAEDDAPGALRLIVLTTDPDGRDIDHAEEWEDGAMGAAARAAGLGKPRAWGRRPRAYDPARALEIEETLYEWGSLGEGCPDGEDPICVTP